MKKFKLVFNEYEYRKFQNSFEFEFEPSDQAKWDELIQIADSGDEVLSEMLGYPKEAPNDPQVWFELFRLIYDFKGLIPQVSENQDLGAIIPNESLNLASHQLIDIKNSTVLSTDDESEDGEIYR